MLKKKALVAKICVDTAENEPSKDFSGDLGAAFAMLPARAPAGDGAGGKREPHRHRDARTSAINRAATGSGGLATTHHSFLNSISAV